MLRKKVEIDGREVEFKASAAVPRIYRMKFRRDLFVDLQKIAKSVKKKGKKEDKESSEIPIEDLEMFENIAYVMAQHADPENVPPDIMDWLLEFRSSLLKIKLLHITCHRVVSLNYSVRSQQADLVF